ncbi:unnamed protein product, partial [Gongylonema pulchrum]|uniref:Armadillo repeat-containing protein 8 n=1 Tax=Gongylonema pulchrum TaxID=637853 RepID=A0A183EEB5_9BILA
MMSAIDKCDHIAEQLYVMYLVPRVIELLKIGATLKIRRNTTHILGSVLSLCSIYTGTIASSGVVPILINWLCDPDRELRESALFALGNLAAENCNCRDLCIKHGMPQKLVLIANKLVFFYKNLSLTLPEARCAVWTASNLCRGKNPPVDVNKIAVLLPLLNEAIQSSDTQIVTDAVRAFARLLDALPVKLYKNILTDVVVDRLVTYLNHPNKNIWSSALLAIGNIVSGDDDQTQSVLDRPDALPNLHRILLDGDPKTKREVAWALSNIAAGNSKQIQAIFDAGIVPSLMNILSNETFRTRTE